jgi:hypothetical protein
MNLLPTWPFVAGALLAGALAGAAADHAIMSAKVARMGASQAEVERQRAEIRAEDEREARAKEQAWTDKAGQLAQEKTDAIHQINAAHAADLERVRQRAERKSAPAGGVQPAAPACQGNTGAELSRPDAEFLVGEAARADSLRAALTQCYRQYDAISK